MASFWVLLVTWLSFAKVTRAVEICPLCETALHIPKRFDYHVGNGRTCLNVYLDIAKLDPTSVQCLSEQILYRAPCCDDAEPAYVPIPPTQAPVYSGPVGNEPPCPVCGTDEYPGIPSAFVKARYVGDFNCAQLYDRGLHGLIPWFMCGPLQDFT
jgi:hypothetical protein